MRALLCLGDREVELTELPLRDPGAGEMRVRTMVSAVCGSDLHHYRAPQTERRERGWARFALGHECTGVVDAIGPGVVHPRVGERVVVYGLVGCGHCLHCRRGEPMFCNDAQHFSRHRDGSDAAFLIAPARNALPLPDDFDFEMGALLSCNVGTAYGALRKIRPSGDTTLAVFGLGPVGLACVMIARAMGARVAGVDLQAARRGLAEQAGAHTTFDAAAADLQDHLHAFGNGSGVHASIDTSGSAAARAAAIDALRVHGTFVEVGVGEDPTIRPTAQLMTKEVTLRGSWLYKQYEWEPLLEFVRSAQVPIKDLVTHRFRIEQAAAAFELADSATAGKILFDWS